MKIDESDATKSDSYPVSPTAQSERAESTSASSLSESADGTLQVTDAEKNASRGSKSNNPSSSQPDSTPAESYVAGTTGGDLGADNASVPTQAATAEKLQTEFVEAQLHSLAPAEVEKVEDGNSGLSHNVLAEDFPTESVSAPAPAHSTPAQAATNVNSEKSPITLQPNESQNTITPIEPAKVDKHVTFDESEDHVIPDTSMRDDDATNSEYSVPAEDDTVHEVVEENAVVKDAPEPVQIIAEPVTEATTMVKTDNVVPERTPEAVPAVEQASAIDVSEINEQTSALTEQAPKVSEESAVAKPAEVEKASEPAAESTLIAKLDKKGEAPNSTSELEDTKATATIAPIVTELHAASDTKPSVVVTPKSPVGSTFSVDSRPTVSGDDRPRGDKSATKKKKRGLEPIRTDIEVPDRRNADDANLSSDDEFMDELQSAVMQEAKPISVSKSPISPMFPTPKKADSWRNKFSRAASNPMKKSEPESQLLTPPKSENPTPTRSVSSSAAYLKKISQEASKPAPTKKVNVGSGIAARMKAFEKFSSGPSTPPVSTGPPPGSTPAFFSVRKASNRVPSRSPGPSVAERANSITRNTPPPESRDSSPETRRTRERSSSIKNRLSSFEPDTVPTPQPTSRPRPESISVTARIIRDPSQPYPSQAELKKDPSEYAPLDLKQSPLVIDHQRAVTAKETIQQRRQSKERRLSNSSDATNTTVKNRRSQGFLILSPALTASGNGKAAAGGATRRFHLSDFRRPVIPDMEMEELPNSVLLDFDVGGGLQIACEDRAGQSRVLEVLQDAHQSVGQSQ
ncbi:hypothetical protein M7I_3567 [Glarea lozoyensis 74030]|uniref:Uncharacterized protein n=1 Tax=Glarea lozoyensis (strain ATCC 74030 / MF5533) TaxID=1104152 RepID=H0ELU6_GLAL7|nr:hypothetical protein M7I_3567 [Glarea lozoyensis 74030]